MNSASTDNTVSGAVTIASTGGQFNAGGVRDDYAANPAAIMTVSGNITGAGGLTCPGPGTVIITSSSVNYGGSTTINSGTLQINSPAGATVALHAVSGSGTLGIGDNTVATSVTADSVNVNTLTLGVGTTLTINAIPGGPTAGSTVDFACSGTGHLGNAHAGRHGTGNLLAPQPVRSWLKNDWGDG